MRALPLLLAALGLLLAPAQVAAATQRRNITVAAARLLDTSWINDVTGLAIPRGNQDSALLGFAAELSLLCYSPWFPAPSRRLFRHLTLVDTPSIWYLPLAYQMGDWAPEAGDTLICEAWECDDGCDPANPALLPDPALDDYIGQAIITMAAFRTVNLVQFDFYRGSTVTANMQLECTECAALNLMGWTNPYKYPTIQPVNGSFAAGVPFNPSPSPSPPPPPSPLPLPSPVAPMPSPVPASSPAAASPSPVPASPSPSSSPASPSPSPSAPVAQSPSPSPSASASPSPPPPSPLASPPPTPFVQSFDGPAESPALQSPAPAPTGSQTRVPVAVQPPPVEPPAQEEQQPAGKGSSTILIAVLAAVGALVAAILIATACVCIRHRRRRAVQPAAPAAASEEGPVLKIRVQKPEHAEAAMRYARAPAAHVITPWRPAVVG